jgi:uncharacterized membrane protein
MIFIKFNGPVLQWAAMKFNSQPAAWMDWVAAHTNIAWTWYVLIGTTICCVVGYAISILTRIPEAELGPAEI